MPEKNLDQLAWLPEWARYVFTPVWILILAWYGGIVNYIRKMKEGEVGRFNITEFIGDMVTSSFAGVIGYFLCRWAGFDEWLTAAVVGMSGHMGSRAIFMLEKWAEQKYQIWTSRGKPKK